MRRLLIVVACAAAFARPVHAQNSQIQGFGGLTFGDVTSSSTFGGGVAVPLTDNVQIIGEAGRITDVVPSLVGVLMDVSPVDVGVSAWYGEGGVRFIGSPRRAVRPYAEATAGIARLRTSFHGAGAADDVINSALGFLSRNEPLLGVGAGVLLQGGPVFLDVGYRYKRIVAGDSLQAFLTGTDVGINQVRVGAGVRF